MSKLIAFFKKPSVESFLHTFITDLIWESSVAAALGHIISNGDFSILALSALGYAVLRTFLRVLREYLKSRYPKPAFEVKPINPQNDLTNAP